MTLVTQIVAALGFCSALIVLWTNPARLVNQVFAFVWLLIGAWFAVVSQAVRMEDLVQIGQTADPIPWLRANAAIGALFPASIWLLKEAISNTGEGSRPIYLRSLPCFLICASLVPLCYTDSFVFRSATETGHARGLPYVVYSTVLLATYGWLILDASRHAREDQGIQRIEMQFLALTIGVACLLGSMITTIGNLVQSTPVRRSSFFIFLSAYAVSGWAITVHRVFDVRHVLLSLGQRVALASVLTLSILALFRALTHFFSTAVNLWVSTVACCSLIFLLERRSRRWLRLDGEEELSRMRTDVIECARTEPQPEKLIEAFEMLLRRHCHTVAVAFLFDHADAYVSEELKLHKNTKYYQALCQIGWATPESLQRRRRYAGLSELRDVLRENSLGLVIACPRSSSTPSLIVAFGVKTNHWPYTYPEIQRLQNIAELMDNILTRSRLTAQAAMKAKMEHLAIMSRGMAHDLKNLITPVSSFLVHTDGRYQPDSVEHEVHTAAKRSMRIISDYVNEALFFANRLEPKLEHIPLRKACDAARELSAERAKRREVAIGVSCPDDLTVTADVVLLQRVLVNLVNNAIDACAAGQAVALSASTEQAGWTRIQVRDNGGGISPENLGCVFDPYFTTKEFGDDVRGFGLGLTICQKIVQLHHGNISVQSELGHGTIVTIDLPTPLPSGRL